MLHRIDWSYAGKVATIIAAVILYVWISLLAVIDELQSEPDVSL